MPFLGARHSGVQDCATYNERYTLWAPFPEETNYFEPSQATSMINFVVTNIEQFFEELRAKGVEVDDKGIEATEQGKFAWCMDPEGNRIELWEPISE